MRHIIKHNLNAEQAKAAAEAAINAYGERFAKYAPAAQWTSETRANVSFKVKGVSLQGALELAPSEIALEMKVPLLFRPFQKKALDLIEREVRRWIGRAETGDL